jgi:hypothetical protein
VLRCGFNAIIIAAGAQSRYNMKAISASIIVFAAAVLLLGGSYIQHSDTKLFVQIVGCIIGLTGLGAWVSTLRDKQT